MRLPTVRDHGNQPQQIQKIPTKWLKIAVGVDHTVVGFHGKASVEKYVLALMNIVSPKSLSSFTHHIEYSINVIYH